MNTLKSQNESHVVLWMNEMNEIKDKVQNVSKSVEERIEKSCEVQEIDSLVSLHILVEEHRNDSVQIQGHEHD